MLTEAGIDHTFTDRTPNGMREYFDKRNINWGYQVCVYYPTGERMISAIEGYGSYGYGGWDHGTCGSDENDGDLIEIMGLLTPEEAECDSVAGYLSAAEVFLRIKEAVECLR
jgi:hypothetical protein